MPPSMHCASVEQAVFLLESDFPVVVMRRARALANRHVVRIAQTKWVMPVGRSLVTSLAARCREFIGVRLAFVKTCKLSVVYILQSLESRHPGGLEPTLGRAYGGGIAWRRRASRQPFLDRRVAL
jgi:hypothetical protein